jgi:SPP1 gp7 family putative phage head morphogenesis protein
METNQNNRSKIEQINKINRDNANIGMKPVYKKQKDVLNKMQIIIGLLYMKYAVEGIINLNRIQRIMLINDTTRKIIPLIKELGDSEVSEVTDILGNAYQDVYYKNADLTRKKVDKLTPKAIKKAVDTKIDKELFSERIWKNKNKLARMLKKSVNNILKGKLTIEDARKQIEKAFNVTAYESHRLLNTELTRVHASASEDIAKKLGIKRHTWSATFEHSCEHCMSLDGQVFDIGDTNVPTIPAHPNCQCMWINLVNNDTNNKNSDIINAGATSGALNPYGKEASNHAEQYYESVRHMKNDFNQIANNTGYKSENILKIKKHIFINKHDLGNGKLERFAPDYEMAQSWQRLIDGKAIEKHDYVLLKHEFNELSLMKKGYSQEHAHDIANKKYNYEKALKER